MYASSTFDSEIISVMRIDRCNLHALGNLYSPQSKKMKTDGHLDYNIYLFQTSAGITITVGNVHNLSMKKC